MKARSATLANLSVFPDLDVIELESIIADGLAPDTDGALSCCALSYSTLITIMNHNESIAQMSPQVNNEIRGFQ